MKCSKCGRLSRFPRCPQCGRDQSINLIQEAKAKRWQRHQEANRLLDLFKKNTKQ